MKKKYNVIKDVYNLSSLIIENKVNEDGYTVIDKVYLSGDIVCCMDTDMLYHIVKRHDSGMLYIVDKPIQLPSDADLLPITKRYELEQLFKAIKGEKNPHVVSSSKMQDWQLAEGGNVVSLIPIENDNVSGLYFDNGNGIVIELHVVMLNSHIISSLHTGKTIGLVEGDKVILPNGVRFTNVVIVDFDKDTIIEYDKKFNGRHYVN